ncbi:MAG: M48 family metallopeptidase [Pseudomonadales bacterium]|nr:M48 family metallopeptidase [Pseudomonadales bacterium]
MQVKKLLPLVLASAFVSGCATDGSFDLNQAVSVGAGVAQAATLSEDEVKLTATKAAAQLDAESKVVPANNAYMQRLAKIVKGVEHYDGLALNFKVYQADSINAFAMADGTVRVHSALLDAMPDDQVLAVIGHEIGHVKLRHSFKQMREQLLTSSAFQAAASTSGYIASLTNSQLGQIAYKAVNAQFSQSDELESDEYAVRLLNALGKDPYAMKRAIETLQKNYGSGGGFLSSHPSNDARIERIVTAIKKNK